MEYKFQPIDLLFILAAWFAIMNQDWFASAVVTTIVVVLRAFTEKNNAPLNKWLVLLGAFLLFIYVILPSFGMQAAFNWDSAAANTQSWWSSLSPMTRNIVYAVLGIMVVVQFFYKKN